MLKFSFRNELDEKLYNVFCMLASDDEFSETIELYIDDNNVVDPTLMIEQFFCHELTNFFDYNDMYFQRKLANDIYLTYKACLRSHLDISSFKFDKEAIFADVEKYSPPLDISHEVLKLVKIIEDTKPQLDETYKDNLLNIDLQDLETVIEEA